MDIIIAAVIFGLITAATVFVVLRFFSKRIENNTMTNMKESFGAASYDALEKNTDQFLKLANEKLAQQTQANVQELAGKKALIDNTLQQMKTEMNSVRELVTRLEKDREQKFGELSRGLQNQSQETLRLHEITGNLNKVLSDSRLRGQWGERVAEDILNLVGMVEGVSYRKQTGLGQGHGRPDFTFLLPDDRLINMDVKFPLDNFKKYLEAGDDTARDSFKKQYLKDARISIKSVTTRDYINPAQNTLDFMIVFIPHEQGYSFLMEHDPSFMDDALKLRIIVCSPWSLYAFLAVIRQSVDNFNLARSADKILTLMSAFYKQWDNYKDAMDKIGKGISALQKEYDLLMTRRTTQLEKPLNQIEQLTRQSDLTTGESKSENWTE